MDFLNGKIKNIYFKYLAAAFGSTLITSIYSIVDMAMVDSIMARRDRRLLRLWLQCGISSIALDF